MMQKKLKLIATLLYGLGLTGLQAQEAFTVTGGNASGSEGTVSYSVGQVFYSTNTGTNGSTAQGVQQPYGIAVVTELEEAKGITLHCTVYPNPVIDMLILRIEGKLQTQYSMSLFSINGELLENKKINSIETTLDMKNLVPATYILKVTDSKKELKTFKIIKN